METQVGKQQRLSKARGLCQLPDAQTNQPRLLSREWKSQGAVQGTELGAGMVLPHSVPGRKPACSWCWALISHTDWWGLSRFQPSLVKWVLRPRNTQDIPSGKSHIPLKDKKKKQERYKHRFFSGCQKMPRIDQYPQCGIVKKYSATIHFGHIKKLSQNK